jgi:lipopolysaccharide transport system ATP-binding protein
LITIYFESSIDGEIGCNYYVLDDKRNLILGAGLNLLDLEKSLIEVTSGCKYRVTFKTRLPLHEGNHSIQLQIVKPTGRDDSAIFLDVIDDALIFKMSRRMGARIWAKAYIENDVEIKLC